jgi:uncharacterized membrane protein
MSGGIINTIFGLMFAAALVAIFWGLVMYFAEIGSEEAKKEFKGVIIGGITALFLLMFLYALVEWLFSLTGM